MPVSEDPDALSAEQARQIVRDLRARQLELGRQNEELRARSTELSEARAKHFDLYDQAPVGYLTLKNTETILEANLTAAEMAGRSRDELINLPMRRLILGEDQDVYDAWRRSLAESSEARACEFRMLRPVSAPLWVRMEATVASDASGESVCRAVLNDITIRKQLDETYRFLLECGIQRTGRGFFEGLSRHLADALGMDYVCIDRLVGDGLSAQTVAVYFDGAFQDNVAYALKDTPCGEVVGKRICCFPANVRRLFPRDVALQEMSAESYLGTTLWSYDGRPIGLIAVIGRRPMTDPGRAESLLNLVALRAAGEMERLGAEETMGRLLMSTSALTGEAFFETLVAELARWTSMRWTFVAEIDRNDAGRAIPIAFWEGGHLRSRSPYRLDGTPCEAAIRDGYLFVGDHVASRYADRPGIGVFGTVSYVGVGMYDSSHVPIGVLGSFHDQPLEVMPPYAREILTLFGHRAAAELLRLRAERELQRRAQELEAFNEALVGREARVIELKAEVNRLSADLNREPPYPPVWEAE